MRVLFSLMTPSYWEGLYYEAGFKNKFSTVHLRTVSECTPGVVSSRDPLTTHKDAVAVFFQPGGWCAIRPYHLTKEEYENKL